MRLHSFIPVIATALVASLGSAAQHPDPIVGRWAGSLVALIHLSGGAENVDVTETSDNSAVFSDNHFVTWDDLETGHWAKSQSQYRANLSKSFASVVESEIGDGTLKRAKFTLSNIELFESAELGALHIGFTVLVNGTKVKEVAKGTFAFDKLPEN